MKKEKGITLVSLIITIILMIIIASTTVYTSTNRFKINNLNKMYNDIELLNDKIDNYYIQYGGIPVLRNDSNEPIQYTFSSLDFDKNVNDNELYYIIDLGAMGDFTLNYGKDGYENPNTSNDVYIMNEKTHTVYYVRGIEYTDGNLYHSKGLENNLKEDTVPPTTPQINVVSGDQIDENNYETNVTLEFVPGKDNWSGVNRTTYSINGSLEQDISNLEQNLYQINSDGTYEITLKTYDNNNIYSEVTRKVHIGVEYLESTATQWIDTGIKASSDVGIDITFSVVEYSNKTNSNQYICFIFGAEDAWIVNSFDYQAGLYGLVYYDTRMGYSYNTETLSDRNTEIHNLRIINQQYYFDDEFQYDLSEITDTTWTSNTNIALYGINRNRNMTRLDSCRIYSCKLYNKENLIMDLVPVLDQNDIACLYDKVEGKFYYNQGTGTFKTNLDG